MSPEEIKRYFERYGSRRERTIVIVDFGNVFKWYANLKWPIGIQQLGQLVKNFSTGKKFLRRFYYGEDYGPDERSRIVDPRSKAIFDMAQMNGFEIIKKRVKYIHDSNYEGGFARKCDLDVEMVVDLIREQKQYDTIVLFSGDGDLAYGLRYLKNESGKSSIIFGARNHVGREMYDAKSDGVVEDIFYADDFEYRLNKDRFRH